MRRMRKKLPNFGDINGEVDPTLRAREVREAMRDVKYGLAVSAGQLDLGGINAMSQGTAALLLRHELRR